MDVAGFEAGDLADAQPGERAEHECELDIGAGDCERGGDRFGLGRFRERLGDADAVVAEHRVGVGEAAAYRPLVQDGQISDRYACLVRAERSLATSSTSAAVALRIDPGACERRTG